MKLRIDGSGSGPKPAGSGASRDSAESHNRGASPSGDRDFAERMCNPAPTHDAAAREKLIEAAYCEAYKRLDLGNGGGPGGSAATPPEVPHSTAFDKGDVGTAARNRANARVAEIRRKRAEDLALNPPPPPADSDSGLEGTRAAHAAAVQRLRGDAEASEPRALLEVSSVVLDGAAALAKQDSTSAAELLVHARNLIDLATDFVPGVSLAKDALTLVTGINPVTSESVGPTEMGLVAAGIVVPGALKGAAKGVTRAVKVVAAAVAHNGSAAHAAKRLYEPLRKAERFVSALRAGSTTEGAFSPEATRRLAQAVDFGGDIVDKTARELRNSPGKAVVSRTLYDSEKLLNGTHTNAGLVPKEVAELISGRDFRNFDAFRETFWRTVADSKYGRQFNQQARKAMGLGRAPIVHESQKIGERKSYELHHMVPINKGGSVYDLSNIAIVTPRFHQEILDRVYHYIP